MSDSLRYRNLEVCEHLAAQYVTGVMTPRVNRRMQRLIETVPEIRQAVAFWAEQLAEVQYELPEQQASEKLLKRINQQLGFAEKQSKSAWWQKLGLWQASSFASMALAAILAVNLFAVKPDVTPPLPVIEAVGASYLAIMNLHDQANEQPEFIISVYQKNEQNPSRLHIQWSEDSDKQWRNAAHLWSEDKKTGQIVYIGKRPAKGEPWHLQKPQWQTITQSSRLLMTNNTEMPNQDNTVFSGICLQLKAWKKKQST